MNMEPEVRYFNIQEDNKYSMVVKSCKNMEDVGDHFVTSAEMKELGHSTFAGHIIKDAAIIADANSWFLKLEENQLRSIKVTDEELVAALKENRRLLEDVGDGELKLRAGRLGRYKDPKPRRKTRATKTDSKTCVEIAVYAAEKRYCLSFPYVAAYNRTANFLKMLKKIVTWKDMKAATHTHNLQWIKKVWDNPQEYLS
jgi:hypothetical protein